MAFATGIPANLCIFCYKTIPPESDPQHTEKINTFCTNLSRLLNCENINEDGDTVAVSSLANHQTFNCCQHCEILITQYSDLYQEIKCLELQLFGRLDCLGKVMKSADELSVGQEANGLDAFRTFRNEMKKKCDEGRKLTTCQSRVQLKKDEAGAHPNATNLGDGSDDDNEVAIDCGTTHIDFLSDPLEFVKTEQVDLENYTDDVNAITNDICHLTNSAPLIITNQVEESVKIEVDVDSNFNFQQDDEEDQDDPLKNNSWDLPSSSAVQGNRKCDSVSHKSPSNRKYKCEICGREITEISNFRRHMTNHSTERPWKCEEPNCGKDFPTKLKLKVHSSCHQNKNPEEWKFECEFCENKFADKRKLEKHLLKHSIRREWKCETCGKDFKSSHCLKKHSIYHKSEEEWKNECEICGKRFPLKATLIRHLPMHTREKNYVCEYCGESYKNKQDWKKHLKSKHNA